MAIDNLIQRTGPTMGAHGPALQLAAKSVENTQPAVNETPPSTTGLALDRLIAWRVGLYGLR